MAFIADSPSYANTRNSKVYTYTSLVGLPHSYVIDGYSIAATGIWDGKHASLSGWNGVVGPKMTLGGPTGLGHNTNPIVGLTTPFRRSENRAVRFTDGYAFGCFNNPTFGNPGTNLDIIAEVIFQANSVNDTGLGSALFGKYDDSGNGGWLIWETSAGHLRYSNENNGYTISNVLTDGDWHHAMVFSVRQANVDGYMILDGGAGAVVIDGTHPGLADSNKPVCIGQEDTTNLGNTSTASVAYASCFVGVFPAVFNKTHMMACAKARFQFLQSNFMKHPGGYGGQKW